MPPIRIDYDRQSTKAPSFTANKLSTMDKSTRFWDRVADSSGEGLGATPQKTVNLTVPFLHAEDVVLDFGCGSGNLSTAIAKHVKQIDGIVPKMQFYQLSNLQGVFEGSGFSLVTAERLSALPEYLLVMKRDK